MPLVLIPTDQTHVFGHLARAYARCGWDVAVGARNFALRSLRADLVHYQLPEEFTRYKPPDARRLAEIRETVDWWARRGPTAISICNLYPHGFERHPAMHELYSTFYHSATLLVHFGQVSLDLVRSEFPESRARRHVVAPHGNYDSLLPEHLDRTRWRQFFGFADRDFVILVFGTLRFWRELRLIQRGYAGAQVKAKRLLMAGRYARESTRWPPPPAGLAVRWRELRWANWLGRNGARPMRNFVPEGEVHRYLEAADAVLVPRLVDLTSGLPALALTFGRIVIAPDYGVYAEWLGGTGNPLYAPGDPDSLARAIERAAALDRPRVEAENRRLADRWTWDLVVRTCLEALELDRSIPNPGFPEPEARDPSRGRSPSESS